MIPPAQEGCYVEKVAYLPDTYQVNDTKRRIADREPTHSEAMLPEKGFVFCCFNNSYKITPEVFDVWMRILKKVDGSILWLVEDNADASRNLGMKPNGAVRPKTVGVRSAPELTGTPRASPSGGLVFGYRAL